MDINELSEDLEQTFGKARNVTEENVRFMLSLVEEQSDGQTVDEDVPKPSVDAMAQTILAVMSYQTTPWSQLAKKPLIRRSLKFIAVRSQSHYDEVEGLIKEVLRKHAEGLNSTMVCGFIKIIRALKDEEKPNRLVEYTPFPERFHAINRGLHQLIDASHPDNAAAVIHCAIDDGILYDNIPRKVIAEEFGLKKSSLDKYFSKYHINLPNESPAVRKQAEALLQYRRKSLRNAVGYTVTSEGEVHFYDRNLGRRSLFSVITAYCRSIFRE